MAKPQSGGNSSAGFDAFFAAIGGQESGGDYTAVNGRTGASGKYQIMPANVPAWGRQYLGMNITLAQFRRDPALQERLARAVLMSYYKKYGARGAAAAWYSGSASRAGDYHKFRSNEPSVGEYVDQVLGRIGNVNPSTGTAVLPGQVQPAASAAMQPAVPKVASSAIGPGLSGAGGDPFSSVKGDPFGANAGDPFHPNTDVQQAAPVPTGKIDALAAAGPKAGESASEFRDRVLSEAMRYIGVPYVWGGTGPKGFDCSGLIKYVYGKLGYSMDRISADQARSGQKVDINSLKAGDLVAWDNSSRNNGADHIAIYAGNGYIIEAPKPGSSVRRRKLGKNENAWGVSLDLPGD